MEFGILYAILIGVGPLGPMTTFKVGQDRKWLLTRNLLGIMIDL